MNGYHISLLRGLDDSNQRSLRRQGLALGQPGSYQRMHCAVAQLHL